MFNCFGILLWTSNWFVYLGDIKMAMCGLRLVWTSNEVADFNEWRDEMYFVTAFELMHKDGMCIVYLGVIRVKWKESVGFDLRDKGEVGGLTAFSYEECY